MIYNFKTCKSEKVLKQKKVVVFIKVAEHLEKTTIMLTLVDC